jgi:hypothetical protein
MLKNIITLVCIILSPALSFGSNVISVQTNKTATGDTGKFSIVMQNDVAINGLNFIVKYNPDLISPLKVIPVGRAENLSGAYGQFFGGENISFIAYDVGSNFILSDSGVIFDVEYVVNDTIRDSTLTDIIFTEGIAADSNLAIVEFEYVNGSIQISPSVGVVEVPSNVPLVFQLFQNFPNPFNPTTKVSFVIGHSSFVTLRVYDILGREVATLVNEKRNAGKYDVIFDGSNLPSGVYFYRLHTDRYTNAKKLILLK